MQVNAQLCSRRLRTKRIPQEIHIAPLTLSQDGTESGLVIIVRVELAVTVQLSVLYGVDDSSLKLLSLLQPFELKQA